MEADVERALATLLDRGGGPFDYVTVKTLANPEKPQVPVVEIPGVDLGAYDRLLGGES